MAEGSDGEANISVVIVFTLLVYLKAKNQSTASVRWQHLCFIAIYWLSSLFTDEDESRWYQKVLKDLFILPHHSWILVCSVHICVFYIHFVPPVVPSRLHLSIA